MRMIVKIVLSISCLVFLSSATFAFDLAEASQGRDCCSKNQCRDVKITADNRALELILKDAKIQSILKSEKFILLTPFRADRYGKYALVTKTHSAAKNRNYARVYAISFRKQCDGTIKVLTNGISTTDRSVRWELLGNPGVYVAIHEDLNR